MSTAAYSPYELLRTLIERVGWPTEVEKRLALESVGQMEAMAIFGNLAQMMECPHDADDIDDHTGKCVNCGKQVQGPQPWRYVRPNDWSYRRDPRPNV